VLFSVVVLLPLSGALLVVVVVVESVDFCVTSGDGAASAPGEVSVVVVVVVSFVVPWHPTIIVPAMKAKAVTAASETIYFEIFMGREYQNSMILHGLKPWATLICLSETGANLCCPTLPIRRNIKDVDRHRGSGCPLTPATPPCIRVRTRRFDWLR